MAGFWRGKDRSTSWGIWLSLRRNDEWNELRVILFLRIVDYNNLLTMSDEDGFEEAKFEINIKN